MRKRAVIKRFGLAFFPFSDVHYGFHFLEITLYAMLTFAATMMAALSAKAVDMQDCQPDKALTGELKKATQGFFSGLIFTEKPYYAGHLSFQDVMDEIRTLKQFEGKIIALNMWAMWCAPCRAEMADLGQLARSQAGDDFEVIAINMDGDSVENARIDDFLREVGAGNLALYRDRDMEIFKKIRRDIPARGLPLTLILDRKGCLLASYVGAAPWGNEDAVHFIQTVKAKTSS